MSAVAPATPAPAAPVAAAPAAAAPAWRRWRLPAAVAEDAAAVLFSLKCFAAAMLAYYIALSIGLSRPFWAVVTSYIIAQPLAGAVISKAAFRLVGTVLGGVAAVAIVPAFVNTPMLLALMLGLWLGLCIYIAQLDRTPRSYAFLLSGYTAMIIGLPAVTAPATVFDSAILRVQEITLGILCASFVHGVIFPVTVTARIASRIETILAETRGWAAASLAGLPEPALDAARRQLAAAVLELHQLSIHLPFDTARIVPRIRTVRALQDRLTLLLPVASVVEERVAELRATPAGLAPGVAALLARISTWIENDVARPGRAATAASLIAAATALEPALDSEGPGARDDLWHDMLTLNLLARLADLVAGLRDAHDLDAQLRTPSVRALSPHVADLLAATSGRPLHLDRAVAIRSGLATLLTILIASAFWIGTAWADGTGAVLIAGVVCALFGAVDNPGAAIGKMQLGSTIGLALALVYAYAVFPRVTDFVTLAAALAPALLVMGVLIGKPALTPIGLGVLIGFPQSVGLYDRYEPDFARSVNGAIAQFIGIGFAGIMLGLVVSVGAGRRAGALARAGWRDVARRARGEAPDTRRWTSRMLDRVGLMLTAAPAPAAPAATAMLDALRDLRTGVVAGDLHALGQTAPAEERGLIGATLAGIDRHFRTLAPAAPAPPPADILAAIDTAARAFARDGDGARRRAGLILLASLRRNLFPAAGPCLTDAPA